MNGILNVYKEQGYTSHDVVAKLRRILKTKKIGHTGTLDPNAEGVLPVCIGKATKVSELLMDKDKTYLVEFKLGKITDTQDVWGQVLKEQEVFATPEEVFEVCNTFIGPIQQIPPMYSAIKQDGKKLYELARQGIEVERPAREVTIHQIDDFTALDDNTYRMSVRCSKGTYIRTLCQDIGLKLCCGACMTALTRTQSGKFDIATALRLDEIDALMQKGGLEEKLVVVEKAFAFPSYQVEEGFHKWLYAGNAVPIDKATLIEGHCEIELESLYQGKKPVYIYDASMHFIGIYSQEEDCFKVMKFLTSEDYNGNETYS